MRKWLSMLLAVIVVGAVVATGCGGSSSSSSPSGGSSSGGGGQMSAKDIVAKSNAAMSNMKSAAMAMDLTIGVKGDASKITDAQTKALLSSPITAKLDGKVANEPQKLDMTVNAKLMGQTFDVGIKMDGDTVYLQYSGQWYSIPKSVAGSITGSTPSPNASEQAKLTDAFKQLGIDPNTWASDFKVVGEEDVNGVATYHLTETIDMAKVATDLSKVAGSASGLGSIVGGSTATTSPADVQKMVDSLQKAVKDVKVDWWVGKSDYYLYKLSASASLDMTALPASDQTSAPGITSVDFAMTMGMSDFDKDFTVTPPSNPKPFDQLMNSLTQSGGLSL